MNKRYVIVILILLPIVYIGVSYFNYLKKRTNLVKVINTIDFKGQVLSFKTKNKKIPTSEEFNEFIKNRENELYSVFNEMDYNIKTFDSGNRILFYEFGCDKKDGDGENIIFFEKLSFLDYLLRINNDIFINEFSLGDDSSSMDYINKQVPLGEDEIKLYSDSLKN